MSKKIKTVQVFLNNHPEEAELSTEYSTYKIEDGCLWIWARELDTKWVNMFPLSSISQVRFYEE